jgi:hypothetical protein
VESRDNWSQYIVALVTVDLLGRKQDAEGSKPQRRLLCDVVSAVVVMRYGDYSRVVGNALKTACCRISTCFTLDGYMERDKSEDEREVAKGTVPFLLRQK